jgi:hypothetical protein
MCSSLSLLLTLHDVCTHFLIWLLVSLLDGCSIPWKFQRIWRKSWTISVLLKVIWSSFLTHTKAEYGDKHDDEQLVCSHYLFLLNLKKCNVSRKYWKFLAQRIGSYLNCDGSEHVNVFKTCQVFLMDEPYLFIGIWIVVRRRSLISQNWGIQFEMWLTRWIWHMEWWEVYSGADLARLSSHLRLCGMLTCMQLPSSTWYTTHSVTCSVPLPCW